MKHLSLRFFLCVFFILFISHILMSQTFLMQNLPEQKPQFSLRFMHPYFVNDEGLSTFSGAYTFSCNIPIAKKVNLVGVIPYSAFSAEDEDNEQAIGDIELGLQLLHKVDDEKKSVTTIGIALPTAPEKESSANLLGFYTNYYNFRGYIPNWLTVYTNFSHHQLQSSGFKIGFEIGPELLIPTKDTGGDTELFAHYALSLGFQATNLSMFTELIGIGIITEDVDDFSDRFTNSLALGAQWLGGVVRPGVFYEKYLDEDMNDLIKGVFGIKVDIVVE